MPFSLNPPGRVPDEVTLTGVPTAGGVLGARSIVSVAGSTDATVKMLAYVRTYFLTGSVQRAIRSKLVKSILPVPVPRNSITCFLSTEDQTVMPTSPSHKESALVHIQSADNVIVMAIRR